MSARRAAAARSSDEAAELWGELGVRVLYFAIRSGRRDIPVSVSLADGAHLLMVVGRDPVADYDLLARLLVEGRRLSRDGFMRWAGDMARDAAVWSVVKRRERTAGFYGFVDALDEFKHRTGRKRRESTADPAVFERIEAQARGKA